MKFHFGSRPLRDFGQVVAADLLRAEIRVSHDGPSPVGQDHPLVGLEPVAFLRVFLGRLGNGMEFEAVAEDGDLRVRIGEIRNGDESIAVCLVAELLL